MTIKQIIQHVTDHGGFTHWFDGIPRNTGYVVGNGKRGRNFNAHTAHMMDETDSIWSANINNVAAEAKRCNFDGYGVWLDEGTVYVDPVWHIDDAAEAEQMCRERGEIAFFDLDLDLSVFITTN